MDHYNFSANGLDFGNYSGDTEQRAKDAFAVDAGYKSWQDMIERAEEFGGNTVEVRLLRDFVPPFTEDDV